MEISKGRLLIVSEKTLPEFQINLPYPRNKLRQEKVQIKSLNGKLPDPSTEQCLDIFHAFF